MARIEGIRIQNFRALGDVTLGKLWNLQDAEPLAPMTAVIGKNGVGKSSLFDAFGFLGDCLRVGVEEACDLRGRGGFQRIRSKGLDGPIEFEVYYKEDGNARPITYEMAVGVDSTGRPYVQKERLRQRRKGQTRGWPFSFLVLNDGKGVAWKGEGEGRQIDEHDRQLDLFGLMASISKGDAQEESRETEVVELDDSRKLGIATLGALKQHPRISAFRRFIEGWLPDDPHATAGRVQHQRHPHDAGETPGSNRRPRRATDVLSHILGRRLGRPGRPGTDRDAAANPPQGTQERTGRGQTAAGGRRPL